MDRKQQERIRKVKAKYGENAFRKFGKLGGNDLLIAQGKGLKITIHRNKKKG